MRVGMLAAIFAVALFNLGGSGRERQSGKPANAAPAPAPAPAPAQNNNFVVAIQEKGGDPARAGNVKIKFYGHDAFEITSPEDLSVLTDPWRNDSTGAFPKWFLRDFPAVSVDVVVSTHAHFDHDAVERPRGTVVLERFAGQFKLGDVEITGLAEKHAGGTQAGETAIPNAIQIVETGGLKIVVWGDNRAAVNSTLDRYLKNVDVLILPVENVLTNEEVNAVVGKYDPKAVIPSHYYVRGLTTDGSGVESVDKWVDDEETKHHLEVRRMDSEELTLSAAALKDAHHRIYYFGNHVALQ
jgi:L-ascorbate metabolism protein UlaG (beta-lactamase superfamily)